MKWPIVSVESIQASKKYATTGGPFGSKLVNRDYVDEGVPVIRGGNLPFGERFSLSELVYVTEDKADTLFSNHAHPGDVVFTQRGTLGQVGLIPYNCGFNKFIVSQSQMKLSVDETQADPVFVYYYFRCPETVETIKGMAISSGVPHINLTLLRGFPIPKPPLPTQRKIASILSAYDDLIENNSRRIAILEEMAQAIYREWFVNFRFPGHENVKFVDSSLGKIPEGWKATTLGQVANVNSLSIKKGNTPDHINYIDIKSVSTGRIDETRPMSFSEAPGRARRIVRHGDTIWSTVRPNRKSYSIILDPVEDTIASTGFAVLSPISVPFSFLYFSTTTEDFASYLVNHATGSAYPAVNAKDFENAVLVIPPSLLLEKFHETAGDMLVIAHLLFRKNDNLRQSRDLLLPKLISGKLDVEDLDIDLGGITQVMARTPTTRKSTTKPSKKTSQSKNRKKTAKKSTTKKTPYKDDMAVVCVLIDELLAADRPTSEFVIQKHAFALKHLRNLSINSCFSVMKAGPWSHELKRKAIFAGQKPGVLVFDERKKTLKKGRNFQIGLEHAKSVLGDQYDVIRELVTDLNMFGDNGLELWMTVYKVVIDLKDKGNRVSRSKIQAGIDNWSGKRKKSHFSISRVDGAIDGMVARGWFELSGP